MTRRFRNLARYFAGTILLPIAGLAAPVAFCNDATLCDVPENILLQLPFTAIAGDVILFDPESSEGSDVFRIFNNVVDTGAGTGLGNLVFLFSGDETTLPPASTWSANAVFITEDSSGVTAYLGNGTNYLLAAPEPRLSGLVGITLLIILLMSSYSNVFKAGL